MRTIALLTIISGAILSAQLTPEGPTRLSHPFPAFSRNGERAIQAHSVFLDSYGKKGQPIKTHLSVLFDPVTGYFLFWYHEPVDAEELGAHRRAIPTDAQRTAIHSTAYVSPTGILWVGVASGLGFSQSHEKAASLDDAEKKAIGILNANILEASRLGDWPPVKNVPLMRDGKMLLPSDFYAPPGSPIRGPVSVIGIAESLEGWEVTLQGQYKARVTLSPTFQPLKAERIDPPKQQ